MCFVTRRTLIARLRVAFVPWWTQSAPEPFPPVSSVIALSHESIHHATVPDIDGSPYYPANRPLVLQYSFDRADVFGTECIEACVYSPYSIIFS